MLNALSSLFHRFTRNEPTIYFHSPCFDGIVSCVLAWEFLETDQRWTIGRIQPVNYDLRAQWLKLRLSKSSAVVDFLYHPSAAFWADHHSTAFVTSAAEAHFRTRSSSEPEVVLYNSRAGSTASLLWSSLPSFFANKHRLREMMLWADKIDSARYDSVKEAIFGAAPALRINLSLMLGGNEYCEFLVRQLRQHDLQFVSELPEVRHRFEEVQRRISRGLDCLHDQIQILDDGIAAFDITVSEDSLVSRYAPYYFYPDARYSIGVFRGEGSVRITAMRNPWVDFESVHLGEIFNSIGGGGHQRVASVVLSGKAIDSAENIADEILTKLREMERVPQFHEAVVA